MITKFENWSNNTDIIGAKVGDVVVCVDGRSPLKTNRRYEILEIISYLSDNEKDYIVKNSKDLVSVRDAETNEVFWKEDDIGDKTENIKLFYVWRFIPELTYNANKYNL